LPGFIAGGPGVVGVMFFLQPLRIAGVGGAIVDCAISSFRGRRLTQHSLRGRPATALPGPDFAPADRASFAWRFTHSITSSARPVARGPTGLIRSLPGVIA